MEPTDAGLGRKMLQGQTCVRKKESGRGENASCLILNRRISVFPVRGHRDRPVYHSAGFSSSCFSPFLLQRFIFRNIRINPTMVIIMTTKVQISNGTR